MIKDFIEQEYPAIIGLIGLSMIGYATNEWRGLLTVDGFFLVGYMIGHLV